MLTLNQAQRRAHTKARKHHELFFVVVEDREYYVCREDELDGFFAGCEPVYFADWIIDYREL